MKSSGRIVLRAVLPLLFLLASCTDPVVIVDEPEKVDSCDLLIPVGIELVNDYVYTLQETDLGITGGDPAHLPPELVVLNRRGEELDRRIVELDCDAVAINRAVADATSGIDSDDPVVAAFLESVRGGIVSPILPTYGEWEFQSGTVGGEPLLPISGSPITMVIERDAASGFAGCNGYYYPAALSDGIWTWADGAATNTELMCVDAGGEEATEVMAIETAYLNALRLVAKYDLTGDSLVLTGDGVELRFVRAGEVEE